MTIVVGDLHGNLQLYREIRDNFKGERVILVGDLLDSFIFSVEDQIQLMKEVLEDGTEAIFGNHELSYLKSFMRCSGYNPATAAHLIHLKNDIFKKFKPFIVVDDILITHAGLNSQLLRANGNISHNLDDIVKFLHNSWRTQGCVYNIGYSRGGRSREAGIFWSDWDTDFNPVSDIRQICGHTPAGTIRTRGDNWCIDCLPSVRKDFSRDPVGVLIDNGKIRTINLT